VGLPPFCAPAAAPSCRAQLGVLSAGISARGAVTATMRLPYSSSRPDVVFGEARRCGIRRDDVAKLRELKLDVERIVARKPVQHRGHPVREVLGAPDAPQAIRRIRIEEHSAAVSIPARQRPSEDPHVRDREVQALRARRGNDVRGVAREEEAAVLHRLDDEAPHPGDSLLEDRAFVERPALDPEPLLKLGPDAVVRPFVQVLVGAAPKGEEYMTTFSEPPQLAPFFREPRS